MVGAVQEMQDWPQTSKEVAQQQLSSPGRDESSIAGTANGLRNALFLVSSLAIQHA